MTAQTLPSPYPYYQVIVNKTSAYLIVHVDDSSTNYGYREYIYRVTKNGYEKTNKNPIGTPEHYWQDMVDLKIIQYIYFDILDEYRENAKVIDFAHAKKVFDDDIPF